MRLHRRSANYREIDPRVWTRGSLVLGNGGLLGGYDVTTHITKEEAQKLMKLLKKLNVEQFEGLFTRD